MTKLSPSQLQHRTIQHRQPSKAARRRVKEAFNPEAMAHLCTTWDFSTYAEKVDLRPARDGRPRFYWHKDNGSDVLAIAHLDSVQDDGQLQITDTAAGLLATSGALDDRLGVYVILDLLPKLGITCDWLLTTDEEIGQSTAEDFLTQKSYNWMFQFDRGGTDVVMYQYETDKLCELVEDAGARVGNGSFSDICLLDHLGVAGFNWGVGYEDYHSARSHAWLEDTFRMVARFEKFFKANASTQLRHDSRLDRFSPDPEFTVAECGDLIDLTDESTYVKEAGYLVCADCGTMPLTFDERTG